MEHLIKDTKSKWSRVELKKRSWKFGYQAAIKDMHTQAEIYRDTKKRTAQRRQNEYDWKDYLYIIPAFILLAIIIASAVINL